MGSVSGLRVSVVAGFHAGCNLFVSASQETCGHLSCTRGLQPLPVRNRRRHDQFTTHQVETAPKWKRSREQNYLQCHVATSTVMPRHALNQLDPRALNNGCWDRQLTRDRQTLFASLKLTALASTAQCLMSLLRSCAHCMWCRSLRAACEPSLTQQAHAGVNTCMCRLPCPFLTWLPRMLEKSGGLGPWFDTYSQDENMHLGGQAGAVHGVSEVSVLPPRSCTGQSGAAGASRVGDGTANFHCPGAPLGPSVSTHVYCTTSLVLSEEARCVSWL